ncbi:unnamed protein product [Aphanomyces euteiches]|uniref:ABC transporter domain-containing protein n=1 Tax=Aphanomyces euteiches TaxID=100861 RepID=A0A6G0XRJ8_9STRA|nr:hypothetical protein Ae201684_001987 [Aphanomyces euteiches]KAH9086970.1 hypothetical protein Ae201684P_000385 [Aphanomyces euteiches]KAH9156072.1 hypothetical protein AeRB84_002005 [Aphanomyces euteiches]
MSDAPADLNLQASASTTYGTTSSKALESNSWARRAVTLHVVDTRKWHYTYMLVLFLDFLVQMAFLSFASQKLADYALYVQITWVVSAGCMVLYVIDMMLRIVSLRGAMLQSSSAILDFLVLCGLNVCLYFRFWHLDTVFWWTMGSFLLTALHIVLKPKTRVFSKKFHKFRAGFEKIRISVSSVRASLNKIPGMKEADIQTLSRKLTQIAGVTDGDMSRAKLMTFLELALVYRPKECSVSEFLSYLRDLDASTYSYGSVDVVLSTLRHWSSQTCDLFMVVLVVCMNASINPLQAIFLNLLSDRAFQAAPSPGFDQDTALLYGVLGLLALCIPFALGDAMIGFFQSKMISKATAQLQTDLLEKILSQPSSFFATRSDGDLNNLFGSDLARVNGLWQAVFWNLINPCVSILFGFGYLLVSLPPLGLLSFAFAFVLVTSGPQGYAAKQSKAFGSQNAYVASDFANAVSCQKVVRAYAIQPTLMGKFHAVVEVLKSAQFRKDFWSGIVQIYVESAMYIFVAVMTASLAIQVRNGSLTSGQFFAYVTMLARVSSPVTILGGFMRVAIGNASSLQRLDLLLALPSGEGGASSTSSTASLPPMQSSVSFENMSFQYKKDGAKVLNNLSATIPKGAYTCLVGPSGCGKSSLLSCLMQFNNITDGAIAIDGVDIKNYSKQSVMAQIAVVFQDGGILNGTVLDNIRFGNLHATDEECIEAAKWAEADKFVTKLPQGYDTVMGQHATCNMSGGQVQRICLARALVRKPSMLLLDEATSALDPETEASVVRTLETLASEYKITIISVTHRLSTARNADLILVLDKGAVAESGTYQELVDKPDSLFSDMVAQGETKAAAQAAPAGGAKHIEVEANKHAAELENFKRQLSSKAKLQGTILTTVALQGGQSKPTLESIHQPLLKDSDDDDKTKYAVL